MKKILLALLITLAIIGGSTCFVSAQQDTGPCGLFDSRAKCYQQLSPITGPNNEPLVDATTFSSYLQSAYRIGIGACFVLGVIMFTWAGIEYVVSESMNSKADGKARMTAALTGLAIALVSYILLYTINPDLLSFKNILPAADTQNAP
jgi:hypothetical protein